MAPPYLHPYSAAFRPDSPSSPLRIDHLEQCLIVSSTFTVRHFSPRPQPPHLRRQHTPSSAPTSRSESFIPILPPTPAVPRTPPPRSRFVEQISRLTLSPPAPHRQAPRPPVYRHRRKRSRHMRMRDPVRSGLFSICEADEDYIEVMPVLSIEPALAPSPCPSFVTSVYQCPSAIASSDIFPAPSPRLALDVPIDATEEGEEVLIDDFDHDDQIDPPLLTDDEANRLSWSTDASDPCPSGSRGSDAEVDSPHVETPSYESEDPFDFDETWSDLGLEEVQRDDATEIRAAAVTTPPKSRRPPPLNLSAPHKLRTTPFNKRHPFATPEPLPSSPLASLNAAPALLSPLPILSPGVYQARRRSASSSSPNTPTRPARQSQRRDNRRHQRITSPDDPIALVDALEELLSSCGEPDFALDLSDHTGADCVDKSRPTSMGSSCSRDSPDIASFPLPPARDVPSPCLASPCLISPYLLTPTTPPRLFHSSLALPSPPSAPKQEETKSFRLKGDHSFLQSMSRGESPPFKAYTGGKINVPLSPASSLSSGSGSSRSSGGGRLPRRSAIPAGWKTFGEPF